MAEIVLRVRLVGGDHLDVLCGEAGAALDDIINPGPGRRGAALQAWRPADSALREGCRHGRGGSARRGPVTSGAVR